MAKGTRGYSSYRGRRAGRKVLAVLLGLVLLVAVAFLLLQRCVVYEADGSFHFELPWSTAAEQQPGQQPEQQPETQKPDDLEIVIEEPEHPVVKELHAVELDTAVLQGDWETALEGLDEDVNAVAIRVKEDSGNILYNSDVPGAAECGAVTGSSIARTALEGLADSDYYAVARISALHDSKFAYAHMADAAVCQLTGYVWYDTNSTHWLAPEKPAAREYVTEIAKECAELGFDELLFDSFTYPRSGRMSRIKTDERTMSKQEALSLLADDLKAALKDYDVKLSATVDADIVLAGSEENSGIVLTQLAKKFDRIYVVAAEDELPALREAMKDIDTPLVPMLAAPGSESEYLIAR